MSSALLTDGLPRQFLDLLRAGLKMAMPRVSAARAAHCSGSRRPLLQRQLRLGRPRAVVAALAALASYRSSLISASDLSPYLLLSDWK